MVLSRILRLLEQPAWRGINNEYHNELAAENSGDLARGQYAVFQSQIANAASRLRKFQAEEKQALRNDHNLQTLTAHMGAFAFQMESAGSHLDGMDESQISGFQMLDSTLRRRFDSILDVLRNFVAVTNQRLEAEKQVVEKLGEGAYIEAQELMGTGEKHLRQGRRTEGDERSDNLREAFRSYERIVDNSIGDKNYVAWFNVGYLCWVHVKSLKEAEEALASAERLSAGAPDPWHTKSLRHLAEVQYLQGKYSDAYVTAQRALSVSREYLSVFNAARYATKMGLKDDAQSLLNESIEMVPMTVEIMYGEEDLS